MSKCQNQNETTQKQTHSPLILTNEPASREKEERERRESPSPIPSLSSDLSTNPRSFLQWRRRRRRRHRQRRWTWRKIHSRTRPMRSLARGNRSSLAGSIISASTPSAMSTATFDSSLSGEYTSQCTREIPTRTLALSVISIPFLRL